MAPRTIRLLHVEDDDLQRLLVAGHLGSMEDFAFTITAADSEDMAVDAFSRQGIEFVVLDYQLQQGNGLHCLQRLRQLDAIVPIMAVSGVATPEIAADLIQAGADDYISKKELSRELLVRSVRSALARADACRRRAGSGSERAGQVDQLFAEICAAFATANGPELLQRLDAFESAARQVRRDAGHLHVTFERTCVELEAKLSASHRPIKRLLRPILLEILLRLCEEPQPPGQPAGPVATPPE
jgi:CheY-like chemotaxis protein